MDSLRDAADNHKPIAFFNLICQRSPCTVSAPEHGSTPATTIKTARDKFRFEICESGTKAERLRKEADRLLNTERTDVTVVAEIPLYAGSHGKSLLEDLDYLGCQATLTVCRLMDYMIGAGAASVGGAASQGDAEKSLGNDNALFQINHARILEPKTSSNVYTNAGDRLFPEVCVIDQTGAVDLRMRQKAALDISGQSTKEKFATLAAEGAHNFPILCSLRIAIRKSGHTDAQYGINAIIVEAEEQDLLLPRSIPNTSMEFVGQLLQSLTPDPRRMVVAPISALRHIRHAGMVVDMPQGEPLPAGSVLAFVGHTGKSVVEDLANGHRIVSKSCWNVPLEEATAVEDGAPEHTDKKVCGEIASYCTMQNVEEYTLSSRKPKEAKYALVVITSVLGTCEGRPHHTYMVDKVSPIEKGNVPTVRNLLRKLARIPATTECQGKPKSSPSWQGDQTPFSVKKARRLSYNPTAEETPTPTKSPPDASANVLAE